MMTAADTQCVDVLIHTRHLKNKYCVIPACNESTSSSSSSSPPGDEWYLCRLTLSTLSQDDLQWTMSPSPFLGAVGPDAAPGSVVYRLSARQRDGTPGQAQFVLLDGESSFSVIDYDNVTMFLSTFQIL